ncbi:MAG: carboxylating nicotinate-nucleotide diphosphorylase [Patescibacteria group bacterium]|jgi:nicotinate-nucleotide pyrophosphorylase (carboxylating)
MNISSYYDRSSELTMTHPWYREQVERYIAGALASDAYYDNTSKKLISRNQQCQAQIIQKQPGVIAGLDEVIWLLKRENISVTLGKKAVLLKLSGNARSILRCERTVLNTLQRLSGIATLTKQCVQMVQDKVKIAATRKTAWGGLDKKAVSLGGGLTHRLHLGDGIMVKDNHLALLDHASLKKANFGKQLCELEIDSIAQLKRAVVQYPQFQILLLDNFSPNKLLYAVHWLAKHKLRNKYILEASGNINLTNIKIYAKTGVDVISMGFLTHSVKALDISLDIIP